MLCCAVLCCAVLYCACCACCAVPCHAVPCWNQVVSTADFVASDDLSHMKNGQLIDLMKQVRDGDLSVDVAVRSADLKSSRLYSSHI